MKNITISALVAGGLFAGLFGAAGVAQAAPGAIGTQVEAGAGAEAGSGQSEFTNRDVVLPDGSINRNGGRLDSNDVLGPARMPMNNWGPTSVWHGQNRFGYGYGSNYNYLLWD